jgi:hypothetical protein
VTTERSIAGPKYRDAKKPGTPASFILGSSSRRDGAALFNPRVLP